MMLGARAATGMAGRGSLAFRGIRRFKETFATLSDIQSEGVFLLFAFPDDPAKVDLPGRRYASGWCRLDEQLVAFEPKTSPLFRAVPAFVSRRINSRNKFIAFDTVFARIGKHRLVKRCTFGIGLSRRATFGGGDRHHASSGCQDKVAVRLEPKEIFCTVFGDHLPR